MNVIAFAGPSLNAEDRAAYPDVDWRPPAEAGDLLRLQPAQGSAICLIDGYFDHRPAVRHKELLLTLSRGILIFGSSSIGALRAAEMDGFGLIGVGAVYRAYASGRLCADDEVALIHASGELGWKPLSLPLVDCRANLHRARRAGILNSEEARGVLNAAKSMHYSDRQWRPLLATADIAPARRSELLRWFQSNGMSQKRLDAIACLTAAASGPIRRFDPPLLVRTSLLDALAAECGVPLKEPN